MISEKNQQKLDAYIKSIEQKEYCCDSGKNRWLRFIEILKSGQDLPFYTSEPCYCITNFSLSGYKK